MHVVSTGDEYSSADHGGKHGDMTGQADPPFFLVGSKKDRKGSARQRQRQTAATT